MLMNVPGVRQRPSPSHRAFIPSRYSRCSGISVAGTLIISRRCRHHQPETSLPTALVLHKPHPQPLQLLLRHLLPPSYALSYCCLFSSTSGLSVHSSEHRRQLRGRFGAEAPMRKIMCVASVKKSASVFFAIFSIGFYALKQLFRDLQ